MKTLLALCLLSLDAQLLAAELATNWVEAAPNFREVDGQLYNAERSTRWQSFTIAGGLVTNGGFVATILRPHYANYSASASGLGRIGGGPVGPAVIAVDGWLPERDIFVTNSPPIPEGTRRAVRLFRAGSETLSGHVLEKWDFGKPHLAAVVTTNLTAGELAGQQRLQAEQAQATAQRIAAFRRAQASNDYAVSAPKTNSP